MKIKNSLIAAVERLEQANNVNLLDRDVAKIEHPCPTCGGGGYKAKISGLGLVTADICPTCLGQGSEA